MRERGILMTAPNVRSIAAGTKSQTRRVVKPAELQRADDIEPHELYPGEWSPWIDGERRATIECPYGVPGDRLWVRETWAQTDARFEPLCPLAYRATDDGRALLHDRWRPSIFMPRWASRITLEVTDVRVERLQEISEADAIAEGVSVHPDHHGKPRDSIYSPVQAYRDLWESINGTGSWDLNPWVWAISFRRVT